MSETPKCYDNHTNLVVAHGRGHDSGPQSGGDADTDASNHATNHDVPQHALLAVSAGGRGVMWLFGYEWVG